MDMVSPALSQPQRLNFRVIPTGISLAYSFFLTALLLLRVANVTHPFILTMIVSMTPFLFILLPIGLALGMLGRSRTAIIYSLLLAIFAVLWLGGIFLPKAAAQSTGQPLNIIVFNSGGRNQLVTQIENWLNNNPADIVLIQETINVRLNPGIENLRQTYPYQAIQTTELNYRGNSTLSVYPIEEEGREGFEPDSIFTRVVIDFNGTPVAVYNVSLAAPFINVSSSSLTSSLMSVLGDYDTDLRDAQLDVLLSRLRAETLPMIVGGDFNMTEFDAYYDQLASLMSDSFREAGTGPGFTFPAGGIYSLRGLLSPILRLDYVWHSEEFHTLEAQVGENLGSDHLPLIMRLDFRND